MNLTECIEIKNNKPEIVCVIVSRCFSKIQLLAYNTEEEFEFAKSNLNISVEKYYVGDIDIEWGVHLSIYLKSLGYEHTDTSYGNGDGDEFKFVLLDSFLNPTTRLL